jgi:hypothetical protein
LTERERTAAREFFLDRDCLYALLGESAKSFKTLEYRFRLDRERAKLLKVIGADPALPDAEGIARLEEWCLERIGPRDPDCRNPHWKYRRMEAMPKDILFDRVYMHLSLQHSRWDEMEAISFPKRAPKPELPEPIQPDAVQQLIEETSIPPSVERVAKSAWSLGDPCAPFNGGNGLPPTSSPRRGRHWTEGPW